MALKDTNPNEEYPYIFLISESICQQTVQKNTDTPIYTLSIVWNSYKVDENDNIIFKPDSQQSYYDDNFYITAVSKAGSGDVTDLNTLNNQVASIKAIVEAETGKTLEVL